MTKYNCAGISFLYQITMCCQLLTADSWSSLDLTYTPGGTLICRPISSACQKTKFLRNPTPNAPLFSSTPTPGHWVLKLTPCPDSGIKMGQSLGFKLIVSLVLIYFGITCHLSPQELLLCVCVWGVHGLCECGVCVCFPPIIDHFDLTNLTPPKKKNKNKNKNKNKTKNIAPQTEHQPSVNI